MRVRISPEVTTKLVELVDTPDLGSGALECVGSSPTLGIVLKRGIDCKNPVELLCNRYNPPGDTRMHSGKYRYQTKG